MFNPIRRRRKVVSSEICKSASRKLGYAIKSFAISLFF